MKLNNYLFLVLIILILILPIIFFTQIKENLSTLSLPLSKYPNSCVDKSWLPEKPFLDSNSANNVLTYTNNKKCDGKYIWNNADEPDTNEVVSWDTNQDCQLNPQYLHSMCLQRRHHDKKRLCGSLTGIVQYPQDADHPKNFEEF